MSGLRFDYPSEQQAGPAASRGLSRRDLAFGAGVLALTGAAGLGVNMAVTAARRPAADVAPYEGLDVPGLSGLIAPNGWPVPGVRMAALRGQVTLVHAFASWCPVCHGEYDFIREIATDHRFTLVGLMVMDREPAAQKFIAARGNPHVALGFDGDGAARRLMKISGVPASFLLDRQGRLLHLVPGALDRSYWEARVAPLIADAYRAG